MSKVASISDKAPRCPYCGTALTSEHPDYTCPRISGVTIDNDGVRVEFHEPELWREYLEGRKDAGSED